MSIKSKICKLCKSELSIDNFWKNPSVKDGYFNKCKTCANKVSEINALKKQRYLKDNLWTCSTCNVTLPLTKENFYKRNDSETGFQHRCKKCLKKDENRVARLVKKDDLLLFLKDRLNGAKHRAISKSIEFDIDLKYLNDLWTSQKGLCNITKIKMNHTILKGKVKNNVSIDRINPELGYVKGNVQLICNIVNVMKSDMSMDDLKYFCKLIIKENG
jgi:hypothetical protein